MHEGPHSMSARTIHPGHTSLGSGTQMVLTLSCPRNATPGSPIIKDLGQSLEPLRSGSMSHDCSWMVTSDYHVYTIHIRLTQDREQYIASAAAPFNPASSAKGAKPVQAKSFKYGTELDWNPAEAAHKAFLKVQHQFLSGSQLYLNPAATPWLALLQRHILTQGLATSLIYLPGRAWLSEGEPGSATNKFSFVLYDGAETIFPCKSLHVRSGRTCARDAVQQLAAHARQLQVEAAPRPSRMKPGGMRVAPVGFLLSLHGQSDYLTEDEKEVIDTCTKHHVSLFRTDLIGDGKGDSITLHIAQPLQPQMTLHRAVATSAMIQSCSQKQSNHVASRSHAYRSSNHRRHKWHPLILRTRPAPISASRFLCCQRTI